MARKARRTVCFLNLINPFVTIWLGEKYTVSFISMTLICINFYLMCNQIPLDTIKEAEGFYKKDRYVPIIQALINIILSVILGMRFDLEGIILGSVISYLVTVSWIKPWLLNKYVFETKSTTYFINQLKYIITLIIIYFISNSVITYIDLPINIISLIINGIITTIIYGLVLCLLYFKNNSFKYIINIIKEIIIKKHNS